MSQLLHGCYDNVNKHDMWVQCDGRNITDIIVIYTLAIKTILFRMMFNSNNHILIKKKKKNIPLFV